ncbi:hypothetical protein ACGFR8_07785 [Streptomyces brevispora]|uniref:hypothetical protein n=1 Tax=Streptomyces brevispora TaxID=887462 RepID=UPI0037231145
MRDLDDFLADLDDVLATTSSASEVGEQPETPAPADPKPEATPDVEPPRTVEEPEPGSWEQVTAGSRRVEPARSRERRISANGWRPYGPSADLDAKVDEDAAPPVHGETADEPQRAAPVRPATPPISGLTKATAVADGDQADERQAEESDGDSQDKPEEDRPPPTRGQLVMTAVQQWRPPIGPRGQGWVRAMAYTGSGIVAGLLTGFTSAFYEVLVTMPFDPDAVGGISLSAAMALLMINRSKKTFIILGAALALVLVVAFLTLPVAAGGLATLIVWGLDQRARTMRQPVAWIVRAVFAAISLATFALVWTTVVHFLTGAAQ